jgi:hypothetical protein
MDGKEWGGSALVGPLDPGKPLSFYVANDCDAELTIQFSSSAPVRVAEGDVRRAPLESLGGSDYLMLDRAHSAWLAHGSCEGIGKGY